MDPRYTVRIKRSALKALQRIRKDIQMQLRKRINALAIDPRPHGVETLKGKGPKILRLRVGKYRVIYTVEDDRLIVLIVRVAHRREYYR